MIHSSLDSLRIVAKQEALSLCLLLQLLWRPGAKEEIASRAIVDSVFVGV